MYYIVILGAILSIFPVYTGSQSSQMDCSTLRMGQFMCPDPKLNQIDAKTQQYQGCRKDNLAKVWCVAVEGINCTESGNSSFTKELPCKWT